MKTLHTGAAAIALILALVLAACDSSQSTSESAQRDVTDTARAAGRQVGDAAQSAGAAVGDAAQSAGAAVGDAAQQAGQALGDTAITTRIKAAFLADSTLDVFDIHVETSDGAVTLTGDVDSQADSVSAASIASDTQGVVSVANLLAIKPKG